MWILAGLAAAGAAWVINARLVKLVGDVAIIWLIPVLEESLKTGIALWWGVPVLLTHSVFGLTEGLHDYLNSRRWGLLAGLGSVCSHWTLGYITVKTYRWTASWVLSILTAVVVHGLWNLAMVFLFSRLSKIRSARGKP